MKSAYEKAMERLEKESGPTAKLNDEQRRRIAEIDRKYDALVAEHKLSAQSKIASAGTALELEQIQSALAAELAGLETRREKEKAAVWNEAS